VKITDRLLADHKAFRKLLDDLEEDVKALPAQRDLAGLRRRVSLLKRMVVFHAGIEDKTYFPALDQAAAGVLPENLLAHSTQEHKTIEGYLDRLEAQVGARPMAPSWPQTFALLSSGLRGHLKREEEEIFPVSERILGEKVLEALAEAAPGEGPAA
jgi:hemerythrin-like domain-containing protein